MKAVLINRSDNWGAEYKKYRSSQEHIQQNQRDNQIQRQRDEAAKVDNPMRKRDGVVTENHPSKR